MKTSIAILAALLLPAATIAAPNSAGFRGAKSYCYYKQATHTWRIGNEAVERTIHFDSARGGLETIRTRAFGRLPQPFATPHVEGRIQLAGPQGPRRLDLDSDWVFQWQSVNVRQHGGRLLTIHMQGTGTNEGFELEAMYEVLPGDRPYLTKSFTLVNRSGNPVTVREVLYDRWSLSAGAAAGGSALSPKAGPTASLTDDRRGSMTVGFDGPGGAVTRSAVQIRACAVVDIAAAPDGGRAYLPTAIVALSRGPAASSIALLQRYEAESRNVVPTGPRL